MQTDLILDEQPDLAVAAQPNTLVLTGHGACFVDRWPDPRALLVETAGNYTLLGDAHALSPADLKPHVKGFVETTGAFVPLLRQAFPDVQTWPRVIFAQTEAPQQEAQQPVATAGYALRRLEPSDARHLTGLTPASAWISKTWRGPQGLAASGHAWGAFVAGQLASVACTFFLGESYEEIGVVTEPEFRKMGLSAACARALCRDTWARGHRPSWTTSPDNAASVRVAEKLGFTWQRDDLLYVVGTSIPQ